MTNSGTGLIPAGSVSPSRKGAGWFKLTTQLWMPCLPTDSMAKMVEPVRGDR